MTVVGRPERIVDHGIADEGSARAATFHELMDRDALDHAYRYATLMLGDRNEAEDAAHDAAMAAWRHLDELRDTARFEAWFARILVNTCRDRLRARRRTGVVRDLSAVVDRSGAGARDPAEAVARHEVMARALSALSSDQREVVVLRFYMDLTIDQIAARTGARAGTVKSRLHYALRAMRAAFDPSTSGDTAP
jgi:RNA polymerase sigma-70 factor (ECF subfamily)